MKDVYWCEQRMGDWGSYTCGKPVKWVVTRTNGIRVHVCGIHVRRYRRNKSATIEASA